jgi:transmembrane 9 superfamily protein 2/4
MTLLLPAIMYVRYSYDQPWDAKKPVLNTCNPGRMIAVSHALSPQPVKEGTEVIFTYDVKFTVSKAAK